VLEIRWVEIRADLFHPPVMKPGWFKILVVGVTLLAAGCSRPAQTPPAATTADPGEPDRAQPKLATMKLWLGAKEVTAEQAVTPEQVETGLMFRKEMGPDEGMLFIFEEPHRPAFWMRHTSLPLSCAYIDSAGVILELHDLKPMDETPVIAEPTSRVQYVLEMNQGWFQRNGIAVGSTVRTERGPLGETYFGRP
jgi:uncharacterized membrane protein (UPF0127 family)